jgi:hypothetical protein
VTLRARWVTLRARWVTLRARWVTLRARLVLGAAKSSLGDVQAAAAAATPAGRAAAASAPAAYLTALEAQLRYKAAAQVALAGRLASVHKNSARSRMNVEDLRGLVGMEQQQAQFVSKAKSMVKDIVGAADELKAGVEAHKASLNKHVRSFTSACGPALQCIDGVLAELQVLPYPPHQSTAWACVQRRKQRW